MMKRRKPQDPYWKAIKEQWPTILMAYQLHEDKKPIIEYQLPDHIVLAYPACEYIDGLSLRTREDTRKQYQLASANQKVIVFIKDMENRILRSYVLPLPDKPAA
ncbi:MAG: hypothetical protein WCA08_02490 [Desulfoferrobacter sp.]